MNLRLARGATPRLDAVLTIFSLIATLAILTQVGIHLQHVGSLEWSSGQVWPRLRFIIFVLVFASLMYGVFVFLLSRLGYYLRFSRFDPGEHSFNLATNDNTVMPPVTVLVPSYKEDLSTIRQTMLSAALQDYPDRRVVLLVDDPPNPASIADRQLLEVARRIPRELSALLDNPLRNALEAKSAFERRCSRSFVPGPELDALANAYIEAAGWFSAQADLVDKDSHIDRLFAMLVFGKHSDALSAAAATFQAHPKHDVPSVGDVRRAYDRLVAQFNVDLDVFERKQFDNCSHEANKAANLNSYIGLIGGAYRVERSSRGSRIVKVDEPRPGDVVVPDATYVVTLDADSLLSPEYTRQLVARMGEPGNERLAVIQTPYSAIPGAPSTIERVAGATTDIQYIVHQGFTWLGATFWVGANALLRKAALDDIRTTTHERGHEIPQYIQDRTVIEDTESSIDLVANGWELHNVPIRMAYSATPPDFGSLLIQRRRWANGGLLILPKLLGHATGRRLGGFGLAEIVVRIHYLASPALASVGLLLLLLLPVSQAYLSPWMALAGVPYFAMYWRDLWNTGYPAADILRVYAFNWLLVPVNLAGVLKSLQQGITGEKIPFGRTPKVSGRTAAPPWSVLSLWALVAFTVAGAAFNAITENWYVFAFALTTALATGYALIAFVGIRESVDDVRAIGIGRWRPNPDLSQPSAGSATSSPGAINR